MDDHAVDDFRRGQHEQAIEVQISLCTATAPPCFLFADGDAAGMYAEHRRIIGDPSRDILRRCIGQTVQVFLRKKSLFQSAVRCLSSLRHLTIDPGLVRGDDALNITDRGAQRCSYQ